MSRLDDRIEGEVRRVADAVAGGERFARVARLKRRRTPIRWTQRGALATAIIVSSAAGAYGLARAFDMDRGTPANDPVVGPTLTPSPAGGACPSSQEEAKGLPTYRPVDDPRSGDVIGDGGSSGVLLLEDRERPPRCRFYMVVHHTDGRSTRSFQTRLAVFEWLPVPPTIFALAEIDGEPGLEVVVEYGGPGHPHRTGEVFTYVPEANLRQGGVALMVLDPSRAEPYSVFPLYGEFPGAVDCTGEPGRIVVTIGEFAPGGDESVWGITRTLYAARGTAFEPIGEEKLTVEVGTEDERWPELADDSFRSCPR